MAHGAVVHLRVIVVGVIHGCVGLFLFGVLSMKDREVRTREIADRRGVAFDVGRKRDRLSKN